jgi:hypothetical protein
MTIRITAEQLIKETLSTYKAKEAPADILLAQTIKRLYPNEDAMTVRATVLENSIAAGIKRLMAGAIAAESDFMRCGQMSLFGELIPEHTVPRSLINKSAQGMADWMDNRARMERDNADELRRAADAQERKARRYEQSSQAVLRVVEALRAAGLNPEEVTYAEALAKAETLSSGTQSVSDAPSKRPLR